MISSLTDVGNIIAQNPRDILLWSNGFFFALALRRGRIEALFDKAVPVNGGPGDKDDSE